MSGFYRLGEPGEDTFVHLNTGRQPSGKKCQFPRFDKDDPRWAICGRPSAALCDHSGCDRPMCDAHRTRHPSLPNTDFCPDHVNDIPKGGGG